MIWDEYDTRMNERNLAASIPFYRLIDFRRTLPRAVNRLIFLDLGTSRDLVIQTASAISRQLAEQL